MLLIPFLILGYTQLQNKYQTIKEVNKSLFTEQKQICPAQLKLRASENK